MRSARGREAGYGLRDDHRSGTPQRGWRHSLHAVLCAVSLAWTTGVAAPARAESSVDLGTLTRETQQQFQDASALEIVWWVPISIWAEIIQGKSDTGPAASGSLPLDDHLVFFVAEATISPLGNIGFRSPEATRKRFRLVHPQKGQIAPLPEEEIPADLRVLLNTLLPALAGGAGKVGESFHPFVFPAAGKDGKRIAAAREPGELVVELGERRFRWRLPLASLLPPKRCPVDGEELSGAFRFCPYHGKELVPLGGVGSPSAEPKAADVSAADTRDRDR